MNKTVLITVGNDSDTRQKFFISILILRKDFIIMKLMVSGSRSIHENNLKIDVFMPDDIDLLITGGARGVDALAERFADENNISKKIFYPEYEKYGKGAPIVRNKKMVELADRVLVFWDGKSSGSKFVYDYAKQLGKPVDMIILKM